MRAGKFGQFEVALDRVFAAIHFGGPAVEKTRALAAIAHSINLFRAADPRDECAPEQSLKIKCEIGPQLSGFFEPWHHADRRAESAKFATRKTMDVIDVGISPQQRREFWIHHPGNCRMRVRITNRRHRRQGVNDVAERTWLDDED